MNIVKIILNQTVDLLFGLTTLLLFISYVFDISKNGEGSGINYTDFLLLVVGYVAFNIINKVRIILKE